MVGRGMGRHGVKVKVGEYFGAWVKGERGRKGNGNVDEGKVMGNKGW